MNRLLQRRSTRFVMAGISGFLFYFSMNRTPLWWAAWLAPIPIMSAAFYAGRRETQILAYFAAGIGFSSNITYYWETAGPMATVLILLLQTIMWGFFVQRTCSLIRASSSWATIFVFPLLLAGMDTLVSFFSPHGTLGSYAYTQMDAIPVIQVASLAGTAGIVFAVGLFASTVAVAFYKRSRIGNPLLAYGLPLLLLVAEFGYGVLRLNHAGPAAIVKIGLASIDDYIGKKTSPEKAEAIWRRYADTVPELASQGARIVVLPEKIAALARDEAQKRKAEFAALAKHTEVYLVAGVQLNGGERKDNASWLFSTRGELLAEYHKQHMVPYLEGDLTPGQKETAYSIDGMQYGLAICRDMIFADFGRKYGRLGVSAMLVPAWDFYRDAWMASRVAALRGVESGYAVVRVGREGYLNVSDRYGRQVAQKRSDYLPGTHVIADVPMEPAKPTIYARFGNVFGWICVAGAILVIALPWKGPVALPDPL